MNCQPSNSRISSQPCNKESKEKHKETLQKIEKILSDSLEKFEDKLNKEGISFVELGNMLGEINIFKSQFY